MSDTDKNNPNNDVYWQSRGYDKKPNNWRELLSEPSKRSLNREKHIPDDGGYTEPFCKDDY